MKRFTETNKWRDPWFRHLSPAAKLLFLYLTDNCDCTGLIDLDLEAATFHVGSHITEKHLAELGDRVQRTAEGKVFIPRFIPFQYGHLSESCPAHKPVLRMVKERNLSIKGKVYQYPNATLPLEYPYSTGKGKGIRKEEEEGVQGEISAEQIYQAYPRHESKPDAIRAIDKAIKKYGAEKILAATLAYAKTQPSRSRFTPLPATWYNAERFNDNPEEWTRSEPNRKALQPDPNQERFEREYAQHLKRQEEKKHIKP